MDRLRKGGCDLLKTDSSMFEEMLRVTSLVFVRWLLAGLVRVTPARIRHQALPTQHPQGARHPPWLSSTCCEDIPTKHNPPTTTNAQASPVAIEHVGISWGRGEYLWWAWRGGGEELGGCAGWSPKAPLCREMRSVTNTVGARCLVGEPQQSFDCADLPPSTTHPLPTGPKHTCVQCCGQGSCRGVH